jgi:MFS family permease
MSEKSEAKKGVKKFAGIEVPSDLTRANFFFLYLNTLFIGMLMVMPAIIQPAFLKDMIKVSPDFFGFINGFLQNMSQVATLAFVGIVGVLSDKVGRKIIAIIGFITLFIFFYLLGLSNQIAAVLHIPADMSAYICAALSFAPAKAAAFTEFAPGLFIAYIIRFIIGIGLVLCYPQFITMVADYTYEKDRGKGMAMNGIMMGLASIIVFAAFAPIGRKGGVSSLFIVSSILSLLGFIFTVIYLKDRLPETKAKKKGLKEIFPVVKKSLPLKASYICCLITRADIVVIATYLVSWAVKSADSYNITSEVATQKGAIPMIVMGLVSFIAFPVIGILLDKWGRVPTIILCLIVGGIGLLLMAASPNPFTGLIFFAVALAGIGMAGSVVGANTLATDASPKDMVGSILGGLNTMQPLGVFFFLLLGGYLFDTYGPGWAFGIKGAANLILAVWMFTVKGGIAAASEEAAASITFTMKWTDGAKKMLEKVPTAFRQPAVDGTEQYAKDHNNTEVTEEVMTAFRKELGM